jgi:triacylglycerol lipase
MTPLGFVETAAPTLESSTPASNGLELHMEETLASAHRIWVRGRLTGSPTDGKNNGDQQGWWPSWGRKPTAVPAPTFHLETRISGQVFEADVPIQPDGRFQATFQATLPSVRRGWRIARTRLSQGEHAAEKCGVVLTPPERAQGVVAVLLPELSINEAEGPERLTNSEAAVRLAPVLRRLQQSPTGPYALYFIGCVPAGKKPRQAELALALTTLGWPGGTFVFIPVEKSASQKAFAEGLDHLRWLFAGKLDMVVLNLEPGIAPALPVLLQPKEDQAVVRRLVNPDEDPSTLLEGPKPAAWQSPNMALRPTRAGLVPRHPVVFCHGMLALSTLSMQLPKDLNCFSPLRQFLRERGFHALFPQVAPTSGVAARAEQLRDQIRAWTDQPVNVIAHSMGGLDARYMITRLGMADRVRSLTTIATPHYGTYLVEWFIANFRQRVPLLLAMEAMGVNVDGFRDCRPDICRAFNASTPDRPEVKYFSFGGAVPAGHVTPFLRRAWNLLTAEEGPNDGMVSVGSARWGEYLGTLHADHFAQTPDMVFVRPNEDFDALGFYFRMLENLARRGF